MVVVILTISSDIFLCTKELYRVASTSARTKTYLPICITTFRVCTLITENVVEAVFIRNLEMLLAVKFKPANHVFFRVIKGDQIKFLLHTVS